MSSTASVAAPVSMLERSGSSASSLSRSRTWSQSVQKYWVSPVLPSETLEQRAKRYEEYFTLTTPQMSHILSEMHKTMEEGMKGHLNSSDGTTTSMLRMLDTCLSKMPSGDEKGVIYCLDFPGQSVRAVRARLEGAGRVTVTEHLVHMSDDADGSTIDLMDERCGALELFDYLAGAVEELMKKTGDLGEKKPEIQVAFTVHFPIDHRSLTQGSILEWTRGFRTGRCTNDPVEGVDLKTLLDMAFWRRHLNAKCCAVINGTAASLLACEYEKPRSLPACAASFVSGEGVNGVYLESSNIKYGYKGALVSTEIGGFDKDLPITDVDLEVDYAEGGCHGEQIFEKMCGGLYLGEVCRRLAVKVYQNHAPPLAWARRSMPTSAAALIVADQTENLSMVEKLVSGLWEWETTVEQRAMIKHLFGLVFSRSAALSAIAIAALAKQSGRLQPAMGGLTIAVDATVHAFHSWYSNSVRSYLKELLNEQASFIHLYVIHDGSTKGGAIAATIA